MTLLLYFLLEMPKPLAFPEPLFVLPNPDATYCPVEGIEQLISYNNNNNLESVLFAQPYPSYEASDFSMVAANFMGYFPRPLAANDGWYKKYQLASVIRPSRYFHPIYEEKHFMQPMGSEATSCSSLDATMGGLYQGEEQGLFVGVHNMDFNQHHGYSSNFLELLGDTKSKQQQQQQQQQHGLIVARCKNATLASNISTSDESLFKVGRISAEERKVKIRRYIKKRNERNFTKKIMYACRKTLADNRPRVRGRFAKNEEFGKVPRSSIDNNDDEVGWSEFIQLHSTLMDMT